MGIPSDGNKVRRIQRLIFILILLGLLGFLQNDVTYAQQGLGRYCSITWASGGWAVEWYPDLVQDPCGNIQQNSDPGGIIQRAGLYSVSGVNNVVVRCGADAGWVGLGGGIGDGPFKFTFDNAVEANQRSCIFTASPQELKIFVRPYENRGGARSGTGFDWARPPYHTLDLSNEFGRPGASTTASVVNWGGEDRSNMGFIDNHDAYDIGMPTGTPIYAVAEGNVLASRFRDVTNILVADPKDPKFGQRGCTASDTQGEIILNHVISGGGPTGLYDEIVQTYYGHLSQIAVQVGDFVQQGQFIGLSGNTGCSSAPHLHFTTSRIKNTAGYFIFPFKINTNFGPGVTDQGSTNTGQVAIDPYGFYPPAGFDPWAWRAYPLGALSIKLWKVGHEIHTW